MNEIKFRVWNEELAEMYEIQKTNYLGSVGISDHNVGGESAIWLRYTGLKDVNGREIYEGDILKVSHPISDVMSGVFSVSVHPISKNFVVGAYNLGAGANKFGEVIGNIFENKNLVEGN